MIRAVLADKKWLGESRVSAPRELLRRFLGVVVRVGIRWIVNCAYPHSEGSWAHNVQVRSIANMWVAVSVSRMVVRCDELEKMMLDKVKRMSRLEPRTWKVSIWKGCVGDVPCCVGRVSLQFFELLE